MDDTSGEGLPAVQKCVFNNEHFWIFGQQRPAAEGHITRQWVLAAQTAMGGLPIDQFVLHQCDLADGDLEHALHQAREMIESLLGQAAAQASAVDGCNPGCVVCWPWTMGHAGKRLVANLFRPFTRKGFYAHVLKVKAGRFICCAQPVLTFASGGPGFAASPCRLHAAAGWSGELCRGIPTARCCWNNRGDRSRTGGDP